MKCGASIRGPTGAPRVSARDALHVIYVVGSQANEATVELVTAWQELGLAARLVSGRELRQEAGPDDVVVGRLDVLPSLDGVEPGLFALLLVERTGIAVLNRAEALLGAHDKLKTANLLAAAGLPHPRTVHVRGPLLPPFDGPYVLKPRYGSWGRDVYLCEDGAELLLRLAAVRGRSWFRRHGALVQEAIPNQGRDLRLVVAAGHVVGAGERVAGAGERRTNVSCGGELGPTDPDPDAVELARAAAAAVDADFVGVDLMPTTDGRLVVLELNGAVEFDDACTLGACGVPEAAATVLGLRGLAGRDRPAISATW